MSLDNGQALDPADHIIATMADDLPSDLRAGNTALAVQGTEEMRVVLRTLSAKKRAFQSTGFSILRVTQEGQEVDVHVPIRSVPFEEYSQLLKESYIEPPRKKQMNIETMEYEMVLDTHTMQYQAQLHDANAVFLKRFALRAMDLQITDEHEQPVWTPDGLHRNETAALHILEEQGFTLGHFQQIRDDAERLSVNSKKVEEALRLKKSLSA